MILVVGSINMDVSFGVGQIPKPGETVLAGYVKKSPGGKGANQAVAAAKMGGEVVMLGCVGTDANGDELLASMCAAGVDTAYIDRLDNQNSSSAFITVSAQGENTIVVDPSTNMQLTPERLLQKEALFQRADYCVLQREIPAETVRTALELCRKHNVRAMVNPSPMDGMTPDQYFGADVLIPNEHEAAALLGKPYEQITDTDWSAFMETHQIRRMIVTLGAQGSLYLEPGKPGIKFAATDHKPVDTTGAGDTFLGTFVAMQAAGKPAAESIRLAHMASGIAVTRRGAQEAMPWLSELGIG